jgi:hypothetical protein
MTRHAAMRPAALVLALGTLLGACSVNEGLPANAPVAGASCDAVRDSAPTEPVYRARCTYGQVTTADIDRLRAFALLKAAEALKKDGFDLVGWTGPYEATLGTDTRGGNSAGPTVAPPVPPGTPGSRGFDYIMRGWKSQGMTVTQVGAHNVSRLIPELRRQAGLTSAN